MLGLLLDCVNLLSDKLQLNNYITNLSLFLSLSLSSLESSFYTGLEQGYLTSS